MDFKSVLDSFDGSIFSEEYLGDFTKIRQHLDLEVRTAGDSGDSEEKAWLKFRQSIFSMLTGNLTKAFDYLREISRIEGLPPEWLLRTAAYNAFYTSLRLYPTIIRFKPYLGGPTAAFRTLELGFAELCNDFVATFQHYLNTDLGLFRFEGRVVMFLLTASLPLHNDAYIHHPAYARGPWEARKETSLQNMTARANIFKANSDQALQLGMYQLHKYLQRLQVELEFGKSPGPSQSVESLKNRYRTFVDKHNLAIIKMLEGDHILSPPFSNPIGLNLMLIEGTQPGSSITPWDSVEDSLKLGDVEVSGQLYRQAYDLFTDSGSPRGQAAVLLRQGCLEHMQAFATDVSPAEKNQRCHAARQNFADSLRLFDLDEAHSQIVRGHQILLNITSGIDENLLAEATKIGLWGRASSNEDVSRFVGILMQRFGRRQMLEYGRNDVALKSYKCAQACFKGLKDRFGLFRGLNSELHLHNSMNDHLATLSMLNEQKEMLKELLQHLTKIEQDYPSSASNCDALRKDMTLVSGNLILSAYQSVGDSIAEDDWKKQLQGLRGGNAGGDFWKPLSSNKDLNKYLFKDRKADDSSLILSGLPNFLLEDEGQHRGLSSFLPSLSRFLVGEQKPSQPRISPSDYVKIGQDVLEKYYEANNKSNADLWKFDVDKAEGHLREYIQKMAPQNVLVHPEAFFPVFAASQVGDFETGRQILKGMINQKFLNNDAIQTIELGPKAPQTSQEKIQELYVLDNVIAACCLSQDWVLGHRVLARIKSLHPKFLDIKSESTSPTLWKRFAKVGVIYEHRNAPVEAFSTLLKAAQLAELDRSFTSDPNSRRGIFGSDPFGNIFTGLARLCLRAGSINLPLAVLDAYPHKHLHAKSWQEHALLFLEKAKARNLLEALTANPANLVDAEERASRARKRRLIMALQSLKKGNDAQEAAKEAEIKALEADLKDYEGEIDPLGTLLPVIDSSISCEDLYKAIGEDELVIEADYTLYGSTIFGITSSGIEFAQQRHKRSIEIRRPVLKAMKHLVEYAEVEDKTSNSRASVEVYLKDISDELILPLQHLIRAKKHVIFITSRPLAAFSFSTLLLDDEPLFLRVAVSQAPSLSTLLHLWESKNVSDGPQETSNTPVSVCTIAKSTRLVDPGETGSQEKLLYLAAIESMVIAGTFKSWPLEGNNIDRDSLQSLIRTGNLDGRNESDGRTRILHIGAHGKYDPEQPWLSYISLKENIRVLDIPQRAPRRHQNIALIVFAACLSGMGQDTTGNDVLGFTHAMLERDCNAYLGALWSVDDRASMLLMIFFYQHLWKSISGTSPSSAQIAKLWQEAQKSLYYLTIGGARELISRLVEMLEGEEKEGHDPKTFVKRWRSRLKEVLEDLENGEVDLKHPSNWGAFVVVGYGGMALRS
jgi:CHAT domain-containing protein